MDSDKQLLAKIEMLRSVARLLNQHAQELSDGNQPTCDLLAIKRAFDQGVIAAEFKALSVEFV